MGRAPCCSKVGLHRGAWSLKEDKLLTHYIQQHGEGHWKSLPSKAGLLRCGKSCRLRWKNYLQPGIKRGNITSDEEELIIRLHSLLGNRWSLIARRLPGRTDNDIKNHWNTHLRKRVIKDQHIDTTENLKSKTKKKGKKVISNEKVAEPNKALERVISNENVLEPNKASESNTSDVSNGGVVLSSATSEALDFTWPLIEEACDEDELQDVMINGWDHSVKCWSVFTDDNKLEKLYDEYLQLLNWDEQE